MVRGEDNEYHTITGNQVGCLLMDYIITAKRANGTLPANAVGLSTIVSTKLVRRICEYNDVHFEETFTGFKFIAERLNELGDKYQYLMGFEEMDSKKTGYDKFNSIGFNFIGLVRSIATMTSRDTIVYFLHHTEIGDDGRVKAKTLGKLIDNHYTLEGLFSVVLLADVDKDHYQFITQSNGRSTAKAPMGMLPPEMDNDLKAVDTPSASTGAWRR
jgi:hypothetical protein